MKLKRAVAVITIAAAVSIVTVLVGLVTNLASSQRNWPAWLRPLRDHPWQSFVLLALAGVGLAVVFSLVTELGTKRRHPSADSQAAPVVTAPDSATVMRTLPRDSTAFTNRVTELQKLAATVAAAEADGRNMPIHAIDGMPGIGKSAFAIHVGHVLAPSFPDGQIFLNLNGHTAGLHPVDPNDALATLLSADGVSAQELPTGTDPSAVLQARAAMWRSRIAERKILIIFDNAASYLQVEPLLPGEGRCLVIVTSRKRLAIPDGVTLQIEALPEEHAVALFQQLAGRTVAAEEDVKEVVKLCGYLPLAISLLAAQLRHHPSWSPADVKVRLLLGRNRLGEIRAGQQAVAAAFDLSFEGLDSAPKTFFCKLGLFPGGEFDAYIAAAINDQEPDEARAILEDLYDQHFLDERGVNRYRLHDLLREYAKLLSKEIGEAERVRIVQRLYSYYSEVLQLANSFISREGPAGRPSGSPQARFPPMRSRGEALDWLAKERANVLALIHSVNTYNMQGAAESVLHLTSAIAPYLRHAGPWDQAALLYRTVADLAMELGDRHAQADALADLGVVSRLMAIYPAATEALQESLKIYRAMADADKEGYVLNQLGIVQYLMSTYDAAQASQTQSLRIYGRLQNSRGRANALADLGMVLRQTGDYEAAAKSQTEALEIYRGLGDTYGQANSLRDLSIIYSVRGEYSTAAQFQSEAYELYKQLGDRIHQAYALNEVGYVQRLRGDPVKAETAHREALELYRELGDRFGEANSLRLLGSVRRAKGDDPALAMELEEQALEIYRELNSRDGEANALNELGVVQDVTCDSVAAISSFERALEIFREIGDRWGEAEALNNWGVAANRVDTKDGARQFDSALSIAEEIGCPLEEARALKGLGRCQLANGDSDGGLKSLRQALAIFKRLGVPEVNSFGEFLTTLVEE